MGIEEQSVHLVSPILQGLSRTDGVGLSVEKRYETGLSDDLGARVPREFTRADLVSKIRSALDAQVISNDYAQTLTDLVEILAKESR